MDRRRLARGCLFTLAVAGTWTVCRPESGARVAASADAPGGASAAAGMQAPSPALPEDSPAAGAAAESAGADRVEAGTAAPGPFGPVEDAESSRDETPEEIYYDLTVFDWYRQGEPLVHEGRAYRPAGPPTSSPPPRLELAGRYGGVNYYAAKDDEQAKDILFVPVFEGYWLRFVAPAAR